MTMESLKFNEERRYKLNVNDTISNLLCLNRETVFIQVSGCYSEVWRSKKSIFSIS